MLGFSDTYFNCVDSSKSDDLSSALGTCAVVVLLFLILIIYLYVWIPKFISFFSIFKKAKRNPWLNLVPFYRTYVICDIAMGIEWFSIVFCLSHILLFLTLFMKGIAQIVLLAWYIAEITLTLNLAKRFNKGAGFAIGLIVLPIIFYPILAFGKSKYIPIGQEQNNYDDIDKEQDKIQNNYDKISNNTQGKEKNLETRDDENEN